jgi:uncharacterized protein (TIGR02594 family)
MQHHIDQPPWLAAAWAELGQHEAPGSATNPRIRAIFADAGHPEVTSDEVAWCSAFVCACLERAQTVSTRSLMARSHLAWGEPLDAPRTGAIAILSRGDDPALGHTGFVAGWTDSAIILLGGNQQDGVTVAPFPVNRLIGLRWPATSAEQPAPVQTPAPASATFETALAHILEMEGGYGDDPADPGGPTNVGITLADYARHKGLTVTDANRAMLIDGLRRIPPGEVRAIYLTAYWQPSHGGELPAALALFHFDTAVNMGTGTAARMLQTALDVTIDGEIGPETRSAAAAADPATLLTAYAELRRRRYRSLAAFPRFGRGWLSRVDTTLRRALALAKSDPPSTSKGTTPMTTQPTDPSQPLPKWWGHSMTIWGALVTGLAAVLPAVGPALGVDISASTVRTAADQVGAVVQAATGLAGTLMVIFGRLRATQPLSQRFVTFKF